MRGIMFCLGLGTSLIATGACGGHRTLTPLMRAARAGDTDEMTRLLDDGGDPDARETADAWTPLLHAVHTRQFEAVRLLLERGANPNTPSGLHRPLAMAAADRDPAILTLLLAHGADVHARGAGGSTALSVAVSGGALTDIDRPLLGGCHLATVRALLAHDPTLRLPDSIAGREALWWAQFNSCSEVLKLVKNS